MKGATALAAALALLTGCASAIEWANAPESNRLANGRCRNPNDATTTIECQQQPPPIARPVEQRQETAPPKSTTKGTLSAGQAEVLSKLQTGREADAAALFWDLPPEARTTEFAAAITKMRTQRVSLLESKPRDVAEAVVNLKLDKLPGDDDVLGALAGRVSKALSNLSKRDGAEEKDFRLGAGLVRVVRQHPSKMTEGATEGVTAFEGKYGPPLAAAELKDESDWQTFIALYPDSKYSKQILENIAQLNQLAAVSAAAKRREQEADHLWDAVQTQGDNLAQLSFKIAFARKQFDPRRARRGIQNMQVHQQMLIKDGFCPAKKDFVDSLGAAEFKTRAAAHCKDEPPTESGVPGVGISLVDECRAAFASGC